MKKYILLFLLAGIYHIGHCQDYICYYIMHVAIDHTLRETERQENIRNNQMLVGTAENVNNNEQKQLQQTYDKIMYRLSSLGHAIDASVVTVEAYPTITQIINTQQNIINTVKDHPELTLVAINSQKGIVEKAQSIGSYMAGLILSIGDINQMKSGNRKLLLEHALSELRSVRALSQTLLSNMRWQIRLHEQQRRETIRWINREKELVIDIINNAKKL